jgi:hypothetical protein
MARRIGASREKVNRKLQSWKAEGWIAIRRSGVRVERKDRLAALVDAKKSA